MRKTFKISVALFFAAACVGQTIDTLSFDKATWLIMHQSPEMAEARMTLAQSQALYDAAEAAQKFQVNLTLNPFSYTNDLELGPNDFWDTTRNISQAVSSSFPNRFY